MRIRQATPDDEAEVTDLLRRFMEFEKTDLLSDEEYRKVFLTVLGQPERTRFIVAETDEGLAGLMTIVIGYSTWKGKTFLTIDDVYVKPEMRKQGAATALLEYAFSLAKDLDCARVDLLTEVDNYRAQALYKKLGFEPVPRIPFTRPV